MSCLAQHQGRLVSANQLAEWTKVPPNYLAKVLQTLAAAKLVSGRRGVGGGYMLAREASGITLLDIVRAIGGGVRGRKSGLPEFEIGDGNWTLEPLYKKIDEAWGAAADCLQRATLQNLMDEGAPTSFALRPVATLTEVAIAAAR